MKKGILLITGLFLLTIGFGLTFYRVSKIKAGTVTTATVLRIESKRDGRNILYSPTLRFINKKNVPMIFKPSFEATDWYTGETAKVLYTQERYGNVFLLSYWRSFGIALLFFCGALVSLFFAAGEYMADRFFKTLTIHNQ